MEDKSLTKKIRDRIINSKKAHEEIVDLENKRRSEEITICEQMNDSLNLKRMVFQINRSQTIEGQYIDNKIDEYEYLVDKGNEIDEVLNKNKVKYMELTLIN